MSLGDVLGLNRLSKHSTIYPGQRLKVRVASRSESSSAGKKVRYVVRRGDNLYHIALRHGTSVDSIRNWNGISRGNLIHPGDVLTLYVR